MDHYERIGRSALLALIPANDPTRSYRRLLASDGIWSQVRNLGMDIDQGLPGHIRHDALKLGVVRGDVFTLVWWARAMSRAATELVAMRKFLGSRNATALAADDAFLKARTKLADALAKVVATTEARFDDPWDVLAMDAASARSAGSTAHRVRAVRGALRGVGAGAGIGRTCADTRIARDSHCRRHARR